MRKLEVYQCEKCCNTFMKEDSAKTHEEKCLPLKEGQRAKFNYGLIVCEGAITELHAPEKLGEKARVIFETGEEIDDVDELHDGRHVWVDREEVLEILPS